MKSQTLVIMLKEPNPGRVKTRLGKDLGMTQAAWWFRHQAQSLIRRLSVDPRWQVMLAVSPDVAGLTSRVWPVHLPRVAQGKGNLGTRMGFILKSVQRGPLLIVGADIPDITPRHIARAFNLLKSKEAVIGPSTDGGYWLIGCKRASTPLPAGIFRDVRWSTPHAMADTLHSLRPLSVTYADILTDIDTASDLSKWHHANL